jgi:hypothetical protein
MNLFSAAYPYLILSYGLFIATILTVVGMIIGLDMLRKDSKYDVSQIIPALFWFSSCALLSGVAIGLTKWALTL